MTDLIPYDQVSSLNTGDILKTNSDYVGLDHYSVAFKRDGKMLISDFNGEIKAWNVPDYEKFRIIYGIIRNEETAKVTDEQVEQAMKDWTGQEWTPHLSCLEFVQSICPSCDLGVDQRVKFGLIIIGIIALLLIAI